MKEEQCSVIGFLISEDVEPEQSERARNTGTPLQQSLRSSGCIHLQGRLCSLLG
jgi:hypothetical protein